jgi:hypothetical protein
MGKITKNNMVKNFAIALFSLLTITGCQKETITPTPPPTTHTIMIVNWSLMDVYLFNRIDQSLNRDLMGRDDLWNRDTVILYTNEIEYTVQKHPKFSGPYYYWGDVRIALYDNGVLKQTYEKQTKEYYIRYKAN